MGVCDFIVMPRNTLPLMPVTPCHSVQVMPRNTSIVVSSMHKQIFIAIPPLKLVMLLVGRDLEIINISYIGLPNVSFAVLTSRLRLP